MSDLLLAFVMAVCPATLIVNDSGVPWTSFDQRTLDRAKQRCGQLYQRSPCLKKFVKRTATDY